MSNFDRFRNKNLNQIVSLKNVNRNFVFKGYPTIEISFINSKEDKKQTVSFVNKQEKDMAYVYTLEDEPLQIGDIFEAKSLICMVTEEIIIIKDVGFRKYIALLCNADLGDGNWGYFKGPEEHYINTIIKEDSTSFSQQKPILVARQGFFNIHDTIKVNGRPWLIIEADTISSPTIGYYSLKATTASKDEEFTEINPPTDEPQLPSDDISVEPLDSISISTEDGYFTSTRKLLNLSIRGDAVSFIVPLNIDEFSVSVKENGEIVNKVYKVVR